MLLLFARSNQVLSSVSLKTENMRVFITVILSLFVLIGTAQDPYFRQLLEPPETVDPSALGWCADQIPPLLQYLDSNNTKAFIVLKDGRIAIEHYFDTFPKTVFGIGHRQENH
ncbi:MAG: hypothetical protein IPI91_20525 [Flavobacteriales bacterium]|nr:hypothetical protein [Flavobacteriales bacterium]